MRGDERMVDEEMVDEELGGCIALMFERGTSENIPPTLPGANTAKQAFMSFSTWYYRSLNPLRKKGNGG